MHDSPGAPARKMLDIAECPWDRFLSDIVHFGEGLGAAAEFEMDQHGQAPAGAFRGG